MGQETGFLEAGQKKVFIDLNEKEPVRPKVIEKDKVADIGGLEMDEKTKRENDEAVEATYQDEQPFTKRMRLKYEEAEGSTREGDQMGAKSFPDPGSGRVDAPDVGKDTEEPAEEDEPGEARKVHAVKDPGDPSCIAAKILKSIAVGIIFHSAAGAPTAWPPRPRNEDILEERRLMKKMTESLDLVWT